MRTTIVDASELDAQVTKIVTLLHGHIVAIVPIKFELGILRVDGEMSQFKIFWVT